MRRCRDGLDKDAVNGGRSDRVERRVLHGVLERIQGRVGGCQQCDYVVSLTNKTKSFRGRRV